MKRKIISYIIGILSCIIIDASFVTIGIYHEAPVSDYILMGIFLPIIDFLFLELVSFTFGYIQLPNIIDDELPKLK